MATILQLVYPRQQGSYQAHDNVPHNADSPALSGIGARISLPVACKTFANLVERLCGPRVDIDGHRTDV